MSQVEDRLRSALATAPRHATTIADPLADLDRRIRRARVRIGGLAIATVAALVAAIVVPLALIGGSESEVPAHPPLIPLPRTANVTSFTTGGGYLWTVTSSPTNRRDRYLLQRRDPSTGAVTNVVRVPAPEEFVTFGDGRVWTFGGGDGGYPQGRIDEYFPSGAHVTGMVLGSEQHPTGLQFAKPSTALAITPTEAYGLEDGGVPTAFSAQPFDLTSLPADHPVPHAVAVFVVGSRLLIVGSQGVLEQLDTTPGPPYLPTMPITVHGLPVGYAPNGLWAAVGTSLVRENVAGQPFVAMPTPGDPVAAVSAPGGGVFVAYQRNSARPTGRSELAYYSADALASTQPRPTATVAGSFDKLVLDPDGGVLAGDEGVGIGRVSRWNPVG